MLLSTMRRRQLRKYLPGKCHRCLTFGGQIGQYRQCPRGNVAKIKYFVNAFTTALSYYNQTIATGRNC